LAFAVAAAAIALTGLGRGAVIESLRGADRHGHQRRGQRSELG